MPILAIPKKLIWWVIAAAVIVIPMYVSPSGQDAFRTPKDLLLMATAAVLIVIGIAAPLRFSRSHRSMAFPVAVGAAVAWGVTSALFAGNRTLAWNSVAFAAAVAVFVLVTWWIAPEKDVRAAYLVAVPAAVNAVVFLLQRFNIWDPLHVAPDLPAHFRYTALVGNPNDVGSFFVAPALAIVTLAIVDVRKRLVWTTLAVVVLAAVATGSLTAIAACIVGLFTLAVVHSHQKAVRAGIAVLLMAFMVAFAFAPLRDRLQRIRELVRSGNYAEAFSGRITPFLAASTMAKDHPIVGVGPGNFAYEYFPYKVSAEAARPELVQQYAHHFNFGQVHNDHLQLLAEIGVVGYLIALALLAVVARGVRRDPQRTQQEEFSRLLSLPLALALATLCLAHFPLHLTAPTLVFGYVAALCVAWSEKQGETAAGLPPPRTEMVVRWAGAGVVAALLVPLGHRFIVMPYRCNVLKPGVQRLTLEAYGSNSSRREETARTNIQRLLPCLDASPHDVDLYMLLAANQRILSRTEDAAATYTRALAYDRRPEIYYNLGNVQLELGKREEAVANLYRAVLFDRALLQEIPSAEIKTEVETLLQRHSPAPAV